MKKLLLVEDNVPFRNSLEVVLKKCFDIDTAGNENEALELLSQNQYQLVSTDGALPEYEGAVIGFHGNLHDSDYRGNTIAKTAKKQGAYVLGLSTEPGRLTEPDQTYHKGKVNLMEYVNTLKQYSGGKLK